MLQKLNENSGEIWATKIHRHENLKGKQTIPALIYCTKRQQ